MTSQITETIILIYFAIRQPSVLGLFRSQIEESIGPGFASNCLRFAAPAEAVHVREVFRPETSRNQVSQIWDGHKQILRTESFRLVPFSAQSDITKVKFH